LIVETDERSISADLLSETIVGLRAHIEARRDALSRAFFRLGPVPCVIAGNKR
jgi:hypothetical protein